MREAMDELRRIIDDASSPGEAMDKAGKFLEDLQKCIPAELMIDDENVE